MSKPTLPIEQPAADIELPQFFEYLGMSIERATAEEAVVRMQAPTQLLSPHGPVHGGAISALIDTAFGIAVVCRLQPGDRTATHQLNINYVSFSHIPVVIATARVLRLGRTGPTPRPRRVAGRDVDRQGTGNVWGLSEKRDARSVKRRVQSAERRAQRAFGRRLFYGPLPLVARRCQVRQAASRDDRGS